MSETVRIEGLSALTAEQQMLMWAFAQSSHVYAMTGDMEAKQRMDKAEARLLAQGVYPCYDDEDRVYTYLFG